jgi:hypothetical protein
MVTASIFPSGEDIARIMFSGASNVAVGWAGFARSYKGMGKIYNCPMEESDSTPDFAPALHIPCVRWPSKAVDDTGNFLYLQRRETSPSVNSGITHVSRLLALTDGLGRPSYRCSYATMGFSEVYQLEK